jgi:hypothetical protein
MCAFGPSVVNLMIHHPPSKLGVLILTFPDPLLLSLPLDCYRWRGGDEVNDRPVGKPQEKGMMNIAASFSLGKKPRFVDPVGKSQYS